MNLDKKTPTTELTRSRQEQWLLPNFIGISHTLEEAKRERKRIEEEHMKLSNRLAHFHKECHRTEKSIEWKRKTLQRILDVKNRRDRDFQNKQGYNEKNRQIQEQLRQRAKNIRDECDEGLQQAQTEKKRRNYQAAQQIRNLWQRELSWKRQRDTINRQWLQTNYSEIEKGKIRGRNKFNSFMSERNGKSLQQYTKKINQQRQLKKRLERQIELMTKEEMEVVERLENSAVRENLLDQTINQAQKFTVKEIKDTLRSGQRPRTLDLARDPARSSQIERSRELQQAMSQQKHPTQEGPTEAISPTNPQRHNFSCTCGYTKSPQAFVTEIHHGRSNRRKRHRKRRRLAEVA